MNEKEKEGTRETIYEREGMLHLASLVGSQLMSAEIVHSVM